MGVAKRLLRFSKPEWSEIDPHEVGTNRSVTLNNNGVTEDEASLWGRIYNLRNPLSSYAASLKAADAVICTDWNSFDVKTQFRDLIATSYRAPIYEAGSTNPGLARNANGSGLFITESDNMVDEAKGFAPFAGCVPLAK